jgi:hypothetical protein
MVGDAMLDVLRGDVDDFTEAPVLSSTSTTGDMRWRRGQRGAKRLRGGCDVTWSRRSATTSRPADLRHAPL